MTETPNPHIVDADSLTGEMHPIRRVVVALGSNLGERLAPLQGAVDALADPPDFFVTGVSPVYETDPVESPEEAGPYLNAVLLADTTLPAARLMERALAIEDAFERERSEIRNAPRTLDVDLVLGIDTRPAAASDDLEHTVNYGSLTTDVKAAVERDPVDLIETVAQRIADVCLLDSRVEWARVTLHKPDAPIDATSEYVALTITRTRGNAHD